MILGTYQKFLLFSPILVIQIFLFLVVENVVLAFSAEISMVQSCFRFGIRASWSINLKDKKWRKRDTNILRESLFFKDKSVFVFLLKGPTPASFSFLFVFYKNRSEKFSRIQTRIVRVEGKDADHYTTTTAQDQPVCQNDVCQPNKPTRLVEYFNFVIFVMQIRHGEKIITRIYSTIVFI